MKHTVTRSVILLLAICCLADGEGRQHPHRQDPQLLHRPLPQTVTGECETILRNFTGGVATPGGTAELLNIALQTAETQAKTRYDALATELITKSTARWVYNHLAHMHPNLETCVATGEVAALTRCIHEGGLDKVKLQWFDPKLPPRIVQKLGPINSVLDFGSGRGDYLQAYQELGVQFCLGIQPGFMGAFAFYSNAWDFTQGPVQIPFPLPEGFTELQTFSCLARGFANPLVDLVHSVEVFEHVPREQHCDLINTLAGYAQRWVVATIAHFGQGGDGHVANRHRLDFASEWQKRGLTFREDLSTHVAGGHGMWAPNMVVLEADPLNFRPVDCYRERPESWAPYENCDKQLIFLPNGKTLPSKEHADKALDWNYVKSLAN